MFKHNPNTFDPNAAHRQAPTMRTGDVVSGTKKPILGPDDQEDEEIEARAERYKKDARRK